MYFLFLLIFAFFLLSIFMTNWPVKLYHHYRIKQLAKVFNAPFEEFGFLFSNVFSQINTSYQGKTLKIRFIDASIDSLKASSGLEIRLGVQTGIVMEFYRLRRNKREWGDFKRFRTGDEFLDSQWFILSNNLEKAAAFWSTHSLKDLFFINFIDQILINQDEMILRLHHYHSPMNVKELVDGLLRSV